MYSFYNRNTVILVDQDETPDERKARELPKTLVVKDVGRLRDAKDWRDAIRTLGNAVNNGENGGCDLTRGKENGKPDWTPPTYQLEVVLKSEDDAKRLDMTKYHQAKSNTTSVFVRRVVKMEEVAKRMEHLRNPDSYYSMSGYEVAEIMKDLADMAAKKAQPTSKTRGVTIWKSRYPGSYYHTRETETTKEAAKTDYHLHKTWSQPSEFCRKRKKLRSDKKLLRRHNSRTREWKQKQQETENSNHNRSPNT
ncbi:hypothetical protein BDR26DRAFT_940382 [Obelidium mucronatum]|nr:hypothetical protein BDR26DRAFT_940382 [Obelidium mucronatum]